MNCIKSFSDIHNTDFNLAKICAINQNWISNGTFAMESPRNTNALLLFCNCSALFEDYENSLSIAVPCKSLFFIPAHSRYKWNFSPDPNKKVSTMLFEFLLFDEIGDTIYIDDKPKILESSEYSLNQVLFHNIISEFAKPDYSYAKIKACAYSLLSSVSAHHRESSIVKGNIDRIYSGIKYLQEDPLQEKSIEEIAAMCNVSINYFEKLFKEYAGCSPSHYRLDKKISKAKFLLESGFLTVGQISDELGFEDCAYFCRVFKKMCGYTPSQYKSLSK